MIEGVLSLSFEIIIKKAFQNGRQSQRIRVYRHNKDKENTYGLILVLHTHLRTHARARALTERTVI